MLYTFGLMWLKFFEYQKHAVNKALTQSERDAIETCILGLTHPDDSDVVSTLRGLLERLK